MRKIKKSDWILLSVLLVLGIVSALMIRGLVGNGGDTVTVTVDGEVVSRLPLDQDTELLIVGYGGGTDLLVIQNGEVFIREASCPDQVCVHTGKADALKSIVCAPNRVVVSIESSQP